MDMTIHSNAGEYIASIFDVAHDAGLSTALFASKEKFLIFKRSWNQIHGARDSSGTDYGKNKIDYYEFNETTSQLVTNFINDLDNNNRHYAFLHIRDSDNVGHKFAWSLVRIPIDPATDSGHFRSGHSATQIMLVNFFNIESGKHARVDRELVNYPTLKIKRTAENCPFLPLVSFLIIDKIAQ